MHIVEARCRTAVSEKELLEVKVAEYEKEKKSSEKKLSHQQTKLSKLTAELKEEKEVSIVPVMWQCCLCSDVLTQWWYFEHSDLIFKWDHEFTVPNYRLNTTILAYSIMCAAKEAIEHPWAWGCIPTP